MARGARQNRAIFVGWRRISGNSIVGGSKVVSARLALVLLTAMTLALGACGRKAGLDLPPSASAAPAGGETSVGEPQAQGAEAAAKNVFDSTANPGDKSKYAPRGQKKRIILDPILD
jgi:predicted small lipoprotein YifL